MRLLKWLKSLPQTRRRYKMAKIYVRRILSGEMTIDDVPERWRAQVQEMLDGEPE